MTEKKVLYVSSEVVPYLPENQASTTAFEVPKMVNERGGQTRIFIPKYGIINERRHQLHEVIRLSGMNLVINDVDMQLIIKVASIPKERMQVYFIDNLDYFKGRGMLKDKQGALYENNDERAIFFAKGVIETVKKLNWSPDIIHVQGWIASLMPLYLRRYYKDEPLFKTTKIVTSVYGQEFEGVISQQLKEKVSFDGIEEAKDLKPLSKADFSGMMQSAIDHSDALVIADKSIDQDLKNYMHASGKPLLQCTNPDQFKDEYEAFYTQIIE